MNKEDNMAGNKFFGKHLKGLRESKGLSQEQLAEAIGVEYQTISRIETGMYFTSYENLQKISNALDLHIKDLFDFSENEYSKEELKIAIDKALTKFDKDDLEITYKLINVLEKKNHQI